MFISTVKSSKYMLLNESRSFPTQFSSCQCQKNLVLYFTKTLWSW